MVSAMTGSVPGKKGIMRAKLTSKEVVKLMGNGINLGNTMEAYGRKALTVIVGQITVRLPSLGKMVFRLYHLEQAINLNNLEDNSLCKKR